MTFHSKLKIGDLVGAGSKDAPIIGTITNMTTNNVEITWHNQQRWHQERAWFDYDAVEDFKDFLDNLAK